VGIFRMATSRSWSPLFRGPLRRIIVHLRRGFVARCHERNQGHMNSIRISDWVVPEGPDALIESGLVLPALSVTWWGPGLGTAGNNPEWVVRRRQSSHSRVLDGESATLPEWAKIKDRAKLRGYLGSPRGGASPAIWQAWHKKTQFYGFPATEFLVYQAPPQTSGKLPPCLPVLLAGPRMGFGMGGPTAPQPMVFFFQTTRWTPMGCFPVKGKHTGRPSSSQPDKGNSSRGPKILWILLPIVGAPTPG